MLVFKGFFIQRVSKIKPCKTKITRTVKNNLKRFSGPVMLKILRSYSFTAVAATNTTVVKQDGRVSETPSFPEKNAE